MPVIADALKLTPPAVYTVAAATAQSVIQTTAGGNLILEAPGSNRLNGKRFGITASGTLATGAGTYTATIAPILYGDASLATVTTKPLFTSTAGTLAYTGTVGAAIDWTLSGWLLGSSASGTFYGSISSEVGGTFKIGTVTVVPVSTINFATEPPIKFAMGFTTVGTLGAAVKMTISEFILTQE